jgi:hypothetical protein
MYIELYMDAANEVAAHHHELGYVQSPCDRPFEFQFVL